MRLKTALLLALTCVLTSCAEVAYAQSLGPAIGSITTAGSSCSTTSTPTNCVSLHLDGKTGAATVQITNTFVGTGQFEVSNDNGTTWAAINGTPPNSTTAVTSSTGTGLWQFNVAGFTDIRVRASAFVSGTMSVVINAAQVSAKSSGGGAVYASGLGTNNVIPKGNGAGQLADSALTDAGTTVVSTEPIQLPSGAKTAAAIQFTADGVTSGWFRNAANNYVLSFGSNGYYGWNTSSFLIGNGADLRFGSGDLTGVATDTILSRKTAASFQLGAADAAAPVAQTLGPQSVVAGTSNIAGARWTLRPSLGTGLAAGSAIAIQRALMLATGTTQQSATDAFVIGETKTLSNTSATATSLVNISVPSNSSAGVQGVINVSCNDGTNFDSETNTFFVSVVNKAGAMTVGTAQLGTPSTANNSGSCTTAITAVAGTNSVDIKVTPVIGTIVPTTVTGTVLSLSSYATGNVTIN